MPTRKIADPTTMNGSLNPPTCTQHSAVHNQAYHLWDICVSLSGVRTTITKCSICLQTRERHIMHILAVYIPPSPMATAALPTPAAAAEPTASAAARTTSESFHSSSIPLLVQPFTRTDLSRRAFRFSAPSVWKSLS